MTPETDLLRRAAARPVLISKSLAQIVTFWRPGSHEWSWAEEYADLMGPRRDVTDRVYARVDSEGIDFADEYAPVLLGSDGRVWDGHHRICIAIQRDIHSLMCEVAGSAAPAPEPLVREDSHGSWMPERWGGEE